MRVVETYYEIFDDTINNFSMKKQYPTIISFKKADHAGKLLTWFLPGLADVLRLNTQLNHWCDFVNH